MAKVTDLAGPYPDLAADDRIQLPPPWPEAAPKETVMGRKGKEEGSGALPPPSLRPRVLPAAARVTVREGATLEGRRRRGLGFCPSRPKKERRGGSGQEDVEMMSPRMSSGDGSCSQRCSWSSSSS